MLLYSTCVVCAYVCVVLLVDLPHLQVAKLLTTAQTLAPLRNCLEPAAARRHAGQPQGVDEQGTWAFESEVASGALAAMVRLTQLAGSGLHALLSV